uniref:Uncharacterized protein n=1 Tax=Oryza brachyantha TaxID=4533 RepID=J3N061_ORYBR
MFPVFGRALALILPDLRSAVSSASSLLIECIVIGSYRPKLPRLSEKPTKWNAIEMPSEKRYTNGTCKTEVRLVQFLPVL